MADLFKPTGVSAYNSSGNVLGWEFNPELYGIQKFLAYKQMTADPQLAGNLALIDSALSGASFKFKGGRDDIREFLDGLYPEDELRRFFSQAADYLAYGCALFEMVPYYDRTTGRYLENSYPRQSWTIMGWDVDQNTSQLKGVKQSGINGSGYVPATRLVLFVNKPDGDNYEGISILRPCYGPWKLKWGQRRIDALGAQRYAAGIPHIKMSPQPTAEQITTAKALGASLSSGDGAYIVTNPADGIMDVTLLTMPGQGYNAEPKVNEYNIEMSRALLGQFMSFTSGSLGGEQLAREMIQLFYNSVQAFGNAMCRVADLQKFHRVVDWNFSGLSPADYPQCEISGVNKPDATTLGTFLAQVLPAFPELKDTLSAKDIDTIKRACGLSGYKEPAPTAEPDNISTTTDQTNLSACGCGKVHLNAENGIFQPRRHLKDYEVKCNFAAMSDRMDRGAATIKSKLAPVIETMAAHYVRFLTPIIQRADIGGIGTLEPRYIDQIEDVMKESAGELFDDGMAAVRDELGGATKLAAKRVPANKLRELALDQAADAGATISRATADTAKQAARRAVQSGLTDAAQIGLSLRIAIDSISESLVNKAAQGTASGAFTNGRDAEAQDYEIKKTWYSAIMDSSTCDVCAAADGQEVIDNLPAAPNPDCESTASGQNYCRCIWVYEV